MFDRQPPPPTSETVPPRHQAVSVRAPQTARRGGQLSPPCDLCITAHEEIFFFGSDLRKKEILHKKRRDERHGEQIAVLHSDCHVNVCSRRTTSRSAAALCVLHAMPSRRRAPAGPGRVLHLDVTSSAPWLRRPVTQLHSSVARPRQVMPLRRRAALSAPPPRLPGERLYISNAERLFGDLRLFLDARAPSPSQTGRDGGGRRSVETLSYPSTSSSVRVCVCVCVCVLWRSRLSACRMSLGSWTLL